MVEKDLLFALVQSMTKMEKFYFKISLSGTSGNNKRFIRLFDTLNAQKTYDEEAIKKKFRKDTDFRHLASVKQYLHRQILRSLKLFYSESSSDMQLNNYLAEIEILYNKELFRNCLHTIKKAKAYAEKYDKLLAHLRILEWEIKVADTTNNLQQLEILKQGALKEEKDILTKYNELGKVKNLYLESRSILQTQGGARTTAERERHNNIAQNPVMKKQTSSFQAESFRLSVGIHSAQFRRDVNAYYALNHSLIQLYEANPHQIYERLNLYVHALIQLTIASFSAKKFLQTQEVLQKLRSIITDKGNRLNIKNNIFFLYADTHFLLQQGKFPQALDNAREINRLLDSSVKELDAVEEIVFFQLQFDVYFRNGDYKTAQHYNQKIINFSAEVRIDLQSAARIINLILQYEQKEYVYLGYALRSTYRFLVKNHRKLEVETIMLNFLKNATKFNSEKKIPFALSELKNQMLPHADHPFIIYFPLLEWIDSKLKKKSLAEVTRNSYAELIAGEQNAKEGNSSITNL